MRWNGRPASFIPRRPPALRERETAPPNAESARDRDGPASKPGGWLTFSALRATVRPAVDPSQTFCSGPQSAAGCKYYESAAGLGGVSSPSLVRLEFASEVNIEGSSCRSNFGARGAAHLPRPSLHSFTNRPETRRCRLSRFVASWWCQALDIGEACTLRDNWKATYPRIHALRSGCGPQRPTRFPSYVGTNRSYGACHGRHTCLGVRQLSVSARALRRARLCTVAIAVPKW